MDQTIDNAALVLDTSLKEFFGEEVYCNGYDAFTSFCKKTAEKIINTDVVEKKIKILSETRKCVKSSKGKICPKCLTKHNMTSSGYCKDCRKLYVNLRNLNKKYEELIGSTPKRFNFKSLKDVNEIKDAIEELEEILASC